MRRLSRARGRGAGTEVPALRRVRAPGGWVSGGVRGRVTVCPVSSIRNPVGPEEPRTYWIRRGLVLGAVVLVLWVGWLLFGAAFGGDDTPQVAASPSPSPTFGISMSPSIDVTEEPSASATAASPSPSESASASPIGSASASALSTAASPSASPRCSDADIAVAVSTASAATPEGQGMKVSMTVTNTGSRVCARDVGAKATDIRITSGSVLVWSWRACSGGSDSTVVALKPGGTWSASATWPGRVTGSGCSSDAAVARAGTYRAVANDSKVTSDPAVFQVT